MISFWSSTGTEHAASIASNVNPVKSNSGPVPTPSPRPSSAIDNSFGLNRPSQLQETSPSPSASSFPADGLADRDRISQLNETVSDLKKLLNEKMTAYDDLNQQTETLLEENHSLKEQIQIFSLSLVSNEEIDSIGL